MNAQRLKKIDPIPAILALAALFLSLYNIQKSGNLNAYYTAAVTSMTQSFHNFFYNSFDPGGFISIDKPPVAFWLQAISVKLLGLHSWTLALPSALAFAGSVILLYLVVRDSFGLAAARLAALILTFTPIAAAVSRTNNVDSVLVFFLLLAVYVLTRAVRNSSLLQLCLAFALVGVGFNTKMLQAYLVLPAFVLFVWAAYRMRKTTWKKTLRHLTAAAGVLVAVSLSWAIIVDVTPADQRPYVGSSRHNSVLELALGYNGIGRLTGDLSGSLASGQNNARIMAQDAVLMPALPLGIDSSRLGEAGLPTNHETQETRSFAPAAEAGAMSSTSEDGPPGLLRLFDAKLAGQITWLLPFALFGAVLLWMRRPERRIEVLLWAGWLLPMIAVFSLAGYFHRYYLIMLAPGIAALAGAAIAELCRSRQLSWIVPGAVIAFVTVAYIAYDDGFPIIGLACAAIGTFALLGLWPKTQIAPKFMLILSLAALLAAPAYWSLTPSLYGVSARQPYASPHLAEGGGSWSRDGEPLDTALVDYLIRNRGSAKYLAAMPSSNSGADSLIIQTGLPVLAWGGFKGVDPALDISGLQKLAKSGELRYVLIGGAHNTQDALARWVQLNGTPVPESSWNAMKKGSVQAFGPSSQDAQGIAGAIGQVVDTLGLNRSYTLYDLSSLSDKED
ncbi:glycosyltransferase family 39 protein [Saccharibacillus endophyticus]|uniref:Mannosyltransferase n=1 Tax=Saccharibacillus endophyticus TaxID=2060666 RepID=A0ABQ2A8D6_9BACL|nr:glycosyltransferase family 39 protein [Saccharibacillus endophyticus]GGH87389.1 mannosyltransferase [Saccharibacillus endophyticus]